MNTFGFGPHSSDDNRDDNPRDNNGKGNNSGDQNGKREKNEKHDSGNPQGEGFDPNNPFSFLFGPGASSGANPFGGGFGFFAASGMGGANQGASDSNRNSGMPFEMGNLGDILNQFGTMFGGPAAAASQSTPDSVNFSVAERVARQVSAQAPTPKSQDSQTVADSVRLVEMWLNDATILPAGATGSTAFNPNEWIDATLDVWKRVITPLADKLGDTSPAGMPADMLSQLGPLASIMKQMNASNFGMQFGHTLGRLASTVVTSTQWGVPLSSDANSHIAAINTGHLAETAKKLGSDARETLIYLAAREAAHHRLFKHVPWLVERLILDVEEFAAGLTLDTSALDEAAQGFNPEMLGDPARLQEMMENLRNMDLSPKIVSSNDHARARLETSLSLVEGWVDYVVGSALTPRIPTTPLLNTAWSALRATESSAMQDLTSAVGLSFTAPKADVAADLWRRLHEAVGMQRRDEVWNHADFLPTVEDLNNPAGFISRIAFDEDEMGDFNPISEIERIERERSEGSAGDGDGVDGADDPGNTDTDSPEKDS